MRAVVQRVSRAQVTVNGEITGRIGRGLLVLLGVSTSDAETDAEYLAEKIAGLRIFEDKDGKMICRLRKPEGLSWQFPNSLYTEIRAAGGDHHLLPPHVRNRLASCTNTSSPASALPGWPAKTAAFRK